MKAQRVRGLTDHEMAKVGVKILDPHGVWLQCERCGAKWSPNIQPGGRLPRGYWKCPNGCNVEEA